MDYAKRWLRAFENGVRERRTDLLPAVAARVAPEYLVISSALHGLLVEIDGEPWDAHLEHPIDDRPRAKCDLVVRERGGAGQYLFEFKTLWPGGLKECAGGLWKDKGKLSGAQNAYVVAFVYSLTDTPTAHRRFRRARAIDELIAVASGQMGCTPCFGQDSDAIQISGFGTEGSAKLVAWNASGEPSE